MLYVNGGWDERFAQLKPAMLTILWAIEEAFSRGDSCVDLGTVEQPYKQRFADGDAPVTWTILLPVRPRAALTWSERGADGRTLEPCETRSCAECR